MTEQKDFCGSHILQVLVVLNSGSPLMWLLQHFGLNPVPLKSSQPSPAAAMSSLEAAAATRPSSQPASSGSAASSASSAAGSAIASSPQPKPRSSVNSEIERLLEQQKLMKQQKKELQNELRNAQRRRKRLKHKARLLTAADLLEVMQLRQDENCQKAARTTEEPPALDALDDEDAEAPRSASPSVHAEDKDEGNADE